MPFAFVWGHSVTLFVSLLPTITLCHTQSLGPALLSKLAVGLGRRWFALFVSDWLKKYSEPMRVELDMWWPGPAFTFSIVYRNVYYF